MFDNAKDLVDANCFPVLSDYNLQLIIGVKEVDIISFDSISEPLCIDELYLAHCKLGWTAYGHERNLCSSSVSCCSYIPVSNEELNNKVDKWLEVGFLERMFDELQLCLSMQMCY